MPKENSRAKKGKGLVSIVILNWNGLDFTKKCLESVKKNTVFPYEIIVVDNGSKGKEVMELKKLEEKGLINKLIINSKNNGFSGGNNQGIKAGKGNYFMLLNNDTTVSKNWLSLLVKAAEKDKSIGIVGPNIVSYYQPNIVFGGGFVDDSGAARHSFKKEKSEAEQVGGAAFMFKKAVLDRIGSLDEGFNPIYFEETDFCARARKAGFKVVFAPESRVVHFEGGVMKKQPGKKQFVTMNKNRIRFMLLHFPKLRLLKAVPYEIGRIVRSFLRLNPHWLFTAYWINFKELPGILGKRKNFGKGNFKA